MNIRPLAASASGLQVGNVLPRRKIDVNKSLPDELNQSNIGRARESWSESGTKGTVGFSTLKNKKVSSTGDVKDVFVPEIRTFEHDSILDDSVTEPPFIKSTLSAVASSGLALASSLQSDSGSTHKIPLGAEWIVDLLNIYSRYFLPWLIVLSELIFSLGCRGFHGRSAADGRYRRKISESQL